MSIGHMSTRTTVWNLDTCFTRTPVLPGHLSYSDTCVPGQKATDKRRSIDFDQTSNVGFWDQQHNNNNNNSNNTLSITDPILTTLMGFDTLGI